ncbi:MAG: hypothetical protein JWP81_2424 [Ferruginibacter sp.]|nr:hypothetical protein [Ferruginibacter sp.]
MNMEKSTNKDLYFTHDHEWIDFQGILAYTGICNFKLLGFKEIDAITFTEPLGFRKQGEVIATIQYRDYTIEAHMPVDGKVLKVNKKLLTGDKHMLLHHPENKGWIALVLPSQPYERIGLLQSQQYHTNAH